MQELGGGDFYFLCVQKKEFQEAGWRGQITF